MMAEVRARVKNPHNQYRSWTNEEEETLRKIYLGHGAKDAAEILDRPIRAVRITASMLGLRVKGSPESRARISEAALVREQKRRGGVFLP